MSKGTKVYVPESLNTFWSGAGVLTTGKVEYTPVYGEDAVQVTMTSGKATGSHGWFPVSQLTFLSHDENDVEDAMYVLRQAVEGARKVGINVKCDVSREIVLRKTIDERL